MNITLVVPILRQILQILGGMLIARGYLDAGAADALAGLVVNAVMLAWWFFDRYQINRTNEAVHQIAKDAIGPEAVKEVVKNA